MPSIGVKEQVARILIEEVAPALGLDGSAIEVLDVTGGVARVRLGGAYARCPTSSMAVIHGIEQELRRRLPDVEYLEALP
jgi:Fe-S cluster biogenesis protein NfuA